MTNSSGERVSRWWNSFYWRLAATFVVFVFAVIMAQSVIFTNQVARSSEENPARAPNNIAASVAAQLSAALAAGDVEDLDTFLRQRVPGERLYVLMKDGRLGSTVADPLRDSIRTAARMSLDGTSPVLPAPQPRLPGPVIFAPVQVAGELRGLVLLPPPPPRGAVWTAARFLSAPGVLILGIATVVAAIVIFGPARRRLVALETAAVRLGEGDLAARASAGGRDEIAHLARAFNQMAAALAARDEALRASDTLRRQLLADVSHELKTPLTAMRGYLETLQIGDPELSADRRRRYVDTIANETRRLERIVGDLVDLARVENNAVTLERRVFAAERVFDHIVRRHERTLHERGIRCEVEILPTADQIYGDPHRLEQVVENLVGNALRYVPDGGTIELRARVVGDSSVISVIDSGPGIPAEHLMHVFDRFYKADPSRAGVGSGLGLSIVKAIVERHGGAVRVDSRPGRTEFTVALPHAVSADEGDDAEALRPGRDQSTSANL